MLEQESVPCTIAADSFAQTVLLIDRNCFRTCLARIGHHVLGGQLYGGYARRRLRLEGLDYSCAIYMSNQAISGFWVDAYVAGPLAV